MSEKAQGGIRGRDRRVSFMIGVFASFLVLSCAMVVAQSLDATESIFGVHALFLYVFVPLLLQSVFVSAYDGGRIESLLIPLASTMVGTVIFIIIMFAPSIPMTESFRALYNSVIASLIGGAIGFAFEGARRGTRMEWAMQKMPPKICWACGSEVSAFAFFCERCGERIR